MSVDGDLDLAAVRAFRAVVRAGTFSAAASALGLPKSTLSKRVADLEADLGVRLIERTTRALRVTAEGEVLLARGERLLGEADDIRRSLTEAGGSPRGHLRLAMPTLMGNLYGGRLLAGFRAAHPEITVECHFMDRAPDLLEEGFDGAVRLGALEEGSLVARSLGEARSVVVAAPALPWLARVREPADLARVPTVGHAGAASWSWTLVDAEGRQVTPPVAPPLLLGSPLAVRDAAVEGAGAALLSAIVAEREVAADRLVRLLPGWATPPRPISFVYPSAQSMTARLRACIDMLVAAFRTGP